jgi:hypothetical protein
MQPQAVDLVVTSYNIGGFGLMGADVPSEPMGLHFIGFGYGVQVVGGESRRGMCMMNMQCIVSTRAWSKMFDYYSRLLVDYRTIALIWAPLAVTYALFSRPALRQ